MSSHGENRSCFYDNFGKLAEVIPDTVQAFMGLHGAAIKSGALDIKTKELIAIAIAVATHCDVCISCHVYDAIEAGASRQEVCEVVGVAMLMGGGPSGVYGSKVLEAFDEFIAAE